MMSEFRLGVVIVWITMPLAGCASIVGDADTGPNPGGGFYTGPNINVGHINPPWFHETGALAERP
jgi:hypothetical protein